MGDEMKTLEELKGQLLEANEDEVKLKEHKTILEAKIKCFDTYPCVKAANHFDKLQIVLFTSPKTGVNINGVGWPHGYHSEGWGEEAFYPFTGPIDYADGVSVDGKRNYENKE